MILERYIHINFYTLINTCMNDFPETYADSQYRFSNWENAIIDYLDIYKVESDIAYPMRRPDAYTPGSWVNGYINRIFDKYFPNEQIVYVDG